MLGFLEKLTLAPEQVGPADMAPLRAAGLGEAAIRDAVYVCALFNVIDRVADALEFREDPEQFPRSAKALLRFGYRI